MINLDSTLKSLEVKLAGAVATTELPFVASYVDINQSSFAISASSENDGTTNGATAATMAAAPGATTTRKINYLSIVNVDTAAATVTVQVNNNATKRINFKVTLQVGDQISFTDANGFVVFDTNGNVKQSFNGILSAANFPALSGDVTTTAGSLVTTIGAGKVTNAMLAGSIAASKLIGTDIATVGTITSGVWNAGAVTSSGTISGVAGTFSGLLTVSGFGTQSFSAGGNGANTVKVSNTTSGTAAIADLQLANDAGTNVYLRFLSSGFTTSGFNIANGLVLENDAAGGISIISAHASGAIRFYSGGTTLRASFDTSGDFQPGSDNTRSLGSTSLRWSELYINPAASGVGDTFICLKSDGQIRSGATCAASTRKIKYAIRDFSNNDLIDQLRPTTYRYRKGFYDQREDIGFIVEDLKQVDTRLAFYAAKGEKLTNGMSIRKGDPITMNTNAVLAIAIQAIQTQKAAIHMLSQRVNHLAHD